MLLCAGAVVVVWISVSFFGDIAHVSGAQIPSRDVLMLSRGKIPPFPDDQMKHLDWFVQVWSGFTTTGFSFLNIKRMVYTYIS